MDIFLAILAGSLFAMGIYLMLQRSLMKLLLGVLCLGYGVNILIFSAPGVVMGKAPIIAETALSLSGIHADPLPQALILTSIVISFGVQSFLVLLIYRIYLSLGVDDVDALREE